MTGCLVPADAEFLSHFEQCTLAKSDWTHLAHIRIAWICLSLSPPDVALGRIREGILRFNTEVLNRRHKYHDTVTVAFARLVSDRMRIGEGWSDFEKRIDDFLDREKPLLLSYYSEDRLFSDEARTGFIEPDLGVIPPWPTIDGGSDG